MWTRKLAGRGKGPGAGAGEPILPPMEAKDGGQGDIFWPKQKKGMSEAGEWQPGKVGWGREKVTQCQASCTDRSQNHAGWRPPPPQTETHIPRWRREPGPLRTALQSLLRHLQAPFPHPGTPAWQIPVINLFRVSSPCTKVKVHPHEQTRAKTQAVESGRLGSNSVLPLPAV